MNNEIALPVDVGDSVVISGAENTLCKHDKQTVKMRDRNWYYVS